jgi:hypothetical protein
MELTFGCTNTVLPISSKMAFCDEWDAETWDEEPQQGSSSSLHQKDLFCLDDLVNEIENTSRKGSVGGLSRVEKTPHWVHCTVPPLLLTSHEKFGCLAYRDTRSHTYFCATISRRSQPSSPCLLAFCWKSVYQMSKLRHLITVCSAPFFMCCFTRFSFQRSERGNKVD